MSNGMYWQGGKWYNSAGAQILSTPALATKAAPQPDVQRWEVVEHEGYTGKVITRDYFMTEDDALDFYERRKSMNRFAGVGDRWTHYWSYPRQVTVSASARVHHYVACGALCPTGKHQCNEGKSVEDPHPTHFFYCECTEIGEN